MAFAPGERGSFQYQMFLWLLGLSRCVGAALGGGMLARETEPRYVIGLFAGFVAVGIGLILVILERKEKRSPIRVDVNSRR